MANAFSVPQSMGTYVDPINTNLVNQVLGAKQQKYDYNVAKVDNLIQQYTNLPLVRDQDKEYLKGRLDTILNTVNSVNKLDMSNNNTTRQIEQSIATAIDDNVLEQMSNSRAIINFEQTVAQKREKNPELYDDRNYSVAKKRAGVDQYLAGVNEKGEKVDKIGNLKYSDYYDVDKNLTGELENWAKNFGFTKSVSEEGNAYFIRKETKEELTPQQIESFYNTKIQADPKLQNQMSINAEAQYGGMSDVEFKDNYLSSVRGKKQELTAFIAKINEEKKNLPVGDPRRDQADDAISTYNEVLSNYDKELTGSTFNRTQKQFEIYSGGLLNNYKNTYAKSEVVAIDYDDTPMKIAEFEMKVAKEAREKVAATTSTLGTPFETATVLAEEKEDVFTQQEKAFTNSFKNIDTYLKANNPEYAKGTPEVKKAIRDQITLNSEKENIAAGTSKELRILADEYVQNSKVYTKVKKEVNKNIDVEIETYFNGMKEDRDKISLSNLAGTLPTTSKLLLDGNVRNFHDLTKEQQAMVKLEMSNNLKNFVAKDELEKKFLTNYNKDIQKSSGIKYKGVEEQPGFLESGWDVLAGTADYLFQGIVGQTAAVVTNLFNTENRVKDLKEKFGYMKEGLDRAGRGLTNIDNANDRIYNPDQNLSEIASNQIELDKGQSLSQRWGTSYRAMEDMAKNSLTSVEANVGKNIGYSYNPNIKEQKPMTDALQSIAFANGYSPVKDAPYRVQISPDKSMAIISISNTDLAINSKGKQTKTIAEDVPIEVPISQLPKSVLDNLNLSEANWNYDYKNPTPFKKTHVHKVFNGASQRDAFLEQFNSSNPGSLSQADYYNIVSNPQSSPLKTSQDYDKMLLNYKVRYGLSDEAVLNMKQAIVQEDYSVEYERVPQHGFVAKIKKGTGKNETEVSRVKLEGVNYDPSTFTMNSFKFIDQAIENQLQEYVRQHSK